MAIVSMGLMALCLAYYWEPTQVLNALLWLVQQCKFFVAKLTAPTSKITKEEDLCSALMSEDNFDDSDEDFDCTRSSNNKSIKGSSSTCYGRRSSKVRVLSIARQAAAKAAVKATLRRQQHQPRRRRAPPRRAASSNNHSSCSSFDFDPKVLNGSTSSNKKKDEGDDYDEFMDEKGWEDLMSQIRCRTTYQHSACGSSSGSSNCNSKYLNSRSRNGSLICSSTTSISLSASVTTSEIHLQDSFSNSSFSAHGAVGGIREIFTEEEFQEVLTCRDTKFVVVQWTAAWCRQASNAVQPTFCSLADTYPEAVFLTANADNLGRLAQAYDVYVLPTVLVLETNTAAAAAADAYPAAVRTMAGESSSATSDSAAAAAAIVKGRYSGDCPEQLWNCIEGALSPSHGKWHHRLSGVPTTMGSFTEMLADVAGIWQTSSHHGNSSHHHHVAAKPRKTYRARKQ